MQIQQIVKQIKTETVTVCKETYGKDGPLAPHSAYAKGFVAPIILAQLGRDLSEGIHSPYGPCEYAHTLRSPNVPEVRAIARSTFLDAELYMSSYLHWQHLFGSGTLL